MMISFDNNEMFKNEYKNRTENQAGDSGQLVRHSASVNGVKLVETSFWNILYAFKSNLARGSFNPETTTKGKLVHRTTVLILVLVVPTSLQKQLPYSEKNLGGLFYLTS